MRHASLAPSLMLLMAATHVGASDGYFDYGYGIKAKGMGGAGVAFAQDSLAPATNPAGLAFISDQLDVGITYFRPDRSSSLNGVDYNANDTAEFWIPEAGIRHGVNDHLALGLTVFGNGGMNTSYTTNIPQFGTSKAGVDLSQLYVLPTASLAITKDHAFGVSAVLAYQRFSASGLENFGINNPGYDESYGAGFRIGYTGKITEWLSVGATYQSRTAMSPFHKYDHLFAESGDFDVPANYAAGIAVIPFAGTTIACDVERILYSSVAAIGNELTPTTMGAGLGADNGPGFGWRDVTVIKVGIAQVITPALIARVGYNHCTQPISEDQTYFNMLAPGVVEHHLSLGGTWNYTPTLEFSMFYAHAFTKTVSGSGNFMGQNADLTMQQDMAGVGIGWKL